MADNSKIEWTDATWNPITGCTKVSEGCRNCYAKRITEKYSGKGSFNNINLHPDRLTIPLRWKKPRIIFCCSMSDLFHPDVPDEFIWNVFQVMGSAKHHIFQVLTKRPERMDETCRAFSCLIDNALRSGSAHSSLPWKHVWYGVSVENQVTADWRIPMLLYTPAQIRWLSIEPLLEPIDLSRYINRLNWVVAGGESGPNARPISPEWVRSIRDQCRSANVPFFFKQWGGVDKALTGRYLDGRTWDQMPVNTKNMENN